MLLSHASIKTTPPVVPFHGCADTVPTTVTSLVYLAIRTNCTLSVAGVNVLVTVASIVSVVPAILVIFAK